MSAPVAMQPGDVLVVTSKSFFGKLIGWRTGSEYRHVAVYSHTDERGVPWCLEARPSSLGWKDASGYLADPWTISNAAQPGRQDRERAPKLMEGFLGRGYDFGGIAGDLAPFLRRELDRLWKATGPGQEPLVCSAFAAAVYQALGWAHPGGDQYRWVTPAGWAQFVVDNGWDKP